MFLHAQIFRDFTFKGGGGVNMFIKNCAKIRGKLSGNWGHLQNKGEDGEVLACRDEGRESCWAGLHPFTGGGGI